MQSQNDSLSQILLAIFSKEQNIRVSAEQEIEKLINNNFGTFLFEISKKLSNEKEEKPVRQLSATIIKNKIRNNSEVWFSLDQSIKDQIKNNILSTLITPDLEVKKAAALSIAGICKVELPRKIWNNIFDILIMASQNDSIDVKITSLITLGYIFEEFAEDPNCIEISNDTIVKLTNMYYSILTINKENENKNMPLIINCLQSIKHFVPYIEGIISNDNSRLVFLNMIKQYMLNNDKDIRRNSISIFSYLIDNYYKYFQSYIDTLMQTLLQILKEDCEENKKFCLEVLCSIGEKETNLTNSSYNVTANFHFLDKYKQQIWQIISNFIITDNFDNEEYCLSKYCFFVIAYMVMTCDFKFTEEMVTYYNNNITSNNPVIKFCALNIFQTILETKEKIKIFQIVQDSLPMLSSILLESQTILSVRKLIAIIMKKITKNFGFLIIKDKDLFDKFMTLFLNLLKDSQPIILKTILEAIIKLVKKIDTNEHLDTNLLSQYSNSYFEQLLSLAKNIDLFDTDVNVPMAALFAIGAFGGHLANDVKVSAITVFKSLTEMFLSTLNKESFKNEQMRLNYQEYICSSLEDLLINKKALDKDARNLFNYIIQSFQQRQEIYEEGISLIGQISFFLQRGFMTEMNIFNSYLLHGLKSKNSFDICKASIMCLDSLIMSTGPDFNIYVGEYLKIILDILSDNQVDRNLKTHCFQVISQLFLFCPQEALKYFNEIIKVVGEAFEACKMDYGKEKDNIDFVNYLMELKENLLETMTSIFTAVEDTGKFEAFIPYAKSTIDYINIFLRDNAQLNNGIILNALTLIASFCERYGPNIKPILNIDLLKETIEKFKKNKDEMESKDNYIDYTISWAQSAITKVVISN